MHSSALLALILLAPPRTEAEPEAVAVSPVACTLRSTHGTPLLLGDVIEQTIELTATGECQALTSGAVLATSDDNQHRSIVSFRQDAGGSTWHLTIKSPIEAPKNGISTTWNVFPSEESMLGGQKASAQVFISAVAVPTDGATRVLYRDSALDELWSTQVNTTHTAYHHRTVDNTSRPINQTTLSLPSMGPTRKWKVCSAATILLTAEGKSTTGRCTDLDNIQTINFTTSTTSTTPITATATATRPSGERFTLQLTLADSAQSSSLPLSIAEIAYVSCQKDVRVTVWDVIYHNKLAAVSNSTIKNGQCTLVISEDEIIAAIARRHGIPHSRGRCPRSYSTQNYSQSASRADRREEKAEAARVTKRCAELKALKNERVTFINTDDANALANLKDLRQLYGRQLAVMYVYTDAEQKDASKRTFYFDAEQVGRREVEINFGTPEPSPSSPYVVEVSSQVIADAADPATASDRFPERTYSSRLRPKGPFGITHFGRSLGSKSFRVFATVPVSFTSIRFPAAGLDLKSSSDSSIAQITTLTTGILLSGEPWDYTRGTNMFAIPFRAQAGLLLSNWYKGVFHPSTFLGGSITLPLWKGATQLDTDLALGVGWEVDLRSGYESFGPRNHLLVTLGLNIFSLFGPQSAPTSK